MPIMLRDKSPLSGMGQQSDYLFIAHSSGQQLQLVLHWNNILNHCNCKETLCILLGLQAPGRAVISISVFYCRIITIQFCIALYHFRLVLLLWHSRLLARSHKRWHGCWHSPVCQPVLSLLLAKCCTLLHRGISHWQVCYCKEKSVCLVISNQKLPCYWFTNNIMAKCILWFEWMIIL